MCDNGPLQEVLDIDPCGREAGICTADLAGEEDIELAFIDQLGADPYEVIAMAFDIPLREHILIHAKVEGADRQRPFAPRLRSKGSGHARTSLVGALRVEAIVSQNGYGWMVVRQRIVR